MYLNIHIFLSRISFLIAPFHCLFPSSPIKLVVYTIHGLWLQLPAFRGNFWLWKALKLTSTYQNKKKKGSPGHEVVTVVFQSLVILLLLSSCQWLFSSSLLSSTTSTWYKITKIKKIKIKKACVWFTVVISDVTAHRRYVETGKVVLTW